MRPVQAAHGGERAACAAALFALWAFGYFWVGRSALTLGAHDLSTVFDRALPFIGLSVWAYLAALPLLVAPVLVLRDRRLFRRTALAYGYTITASLACFASFPVSGVILRNNSAALALDPVTRWVVQTLHAIDPPYNLFPSLHVSLSALAAWSMASAAPRSRALCYGALTMVAISTCTIKQHVVLDVLGGLALALVAGACTCMSRTMHAERA
jgi:membrane-associated phospholipid phosphatase